MKLNAGVTIKDEGESIGTVGSYIQQYKDIESGKISTAKSPSSFKSNHRSHKILPSEWKPSTEKEILIHYCKRAGCKDFVDLDEKCGQIAFSINRLYSAGLTPEKTSDKIEEHITQEDLFDDELEKGVLKKESSSSLKDKMYPKLNVELTEGSYKYVKGLVPLTEKQLDLSIFINPKYLVFSSDEYHFFLSIAPNKDKEFDKLFNFTPKENLVFEMFKEQLGDEHKAKKLVLMSRLMNETDLPSKSKKVIRKKTIKKSLKE